MNKKDLKFEQHPTAKLITPPLTSEELEAYELDILKNGQIDDVVLYEGKVLDKWHMYNVLLKHNIKPRFKEFSLNGVGSAIDFVAAKLKGRNINASQKACITVLYDIEINGHIDANARRSAASANWQESVRTGTPYKAPHATRADVCKLFGASITFYNYAYVLFKEDRKSFDKCLSLGENVDIAYRLHRRANRARHVGGTKVQCDNRIELTKNHIVIPSPCDTGAIMNNFMRNMAAHGWKFELRMVAGKFYGNFYGNGFSENRNGYKTIDGANTYELCVVQAAFERVGKK